VQPVKSSGVRIMANIRLICPAFTTVPMTKPMPAPANPASTIMPTSTPMRPPRMG
jgi:hypothetical protein